MFYVPSTIAPREPKSCIPNMTHSVPKTSHYLFQRKVRSLIDWFFKGMRQRPYHIIKPSWTFSGSRTSGKGGLSSGQGIDYLFGTSGLLIHIIFFLFSCTSKKAHRQCEMHVCKCSRNTGCHGYATDSWWLQIWFCCCIKGKLFPGLESWCWCGAYSRISEHMMHQLWSVAEWETSCEQDVLHPESHIGKKMQDIAVINKEFNLNLCPAHLCNPFHN